MGGKLLNKWEFGPHKVKRISAHAEKRGGHWYSTFQCIVCASPFTARMSHVENGSIMTCPSCHGKTRTGAGNANYKDLSGARFGKLTAIRPVEKDAALHGWRAGVSTTLWECSCDCGNSIVRTTNELTCGGVGSCGHCGYTSAGEQAIAENLDALGIEYVRQHRFNTCKDTFSLPFDFYLPGVNLCIEYDGLGHYAAAEGGWRTEENVAATRKHDTMKDKWCAGNGVALWRIPYWEYRVIADADSFRERLSAIIDRAISDNSRRICDGSEGGEADVRCDV